ncbi:hypothetical protein MHM88_22905 [Epibacterium sp. MM17-32]|uniref:hypothetical protein n=1 Tax=Epibacterium sp. MM17-32 TaxID=2917734 RepID=UPI001EF40619|nr:hypothetical protein [Epibacterium sp. MM17-32]MCG7630660.1 hypothetical protein [Epibacterium sp. MM17-32]
MAGALASLPDLSVAAAIDPVVPHYREWNSATTEWLRLSHMPGNGDWEWPESLAAESRAEVALRNMVAHTPTTPEGVAACTHAVWRLIGPGCAPSTPDFQRELALPEFKLLAAIWRATGGEGAYPA